MMPLIVALACFIAMMFVVAVFVICVDTVDHGGGG